MKRAISLCTLLIASLFLNTIKSELPYYNPKCKSSDDRNLINKITTTPVNKDRLAQNGLNSGNFPIRYVKNVGQVSDENGNPVNDVLYVVKQKNMTVYIREQGLTYVQEVIEIDNIDDLPEDPDSYKAPSARVTGHRTDLNFIGSNKPNRVVEKKSHNYSEHYYLSRNNVSMKANSFESILLEGVYHGIDLLMYIKDGNLKYDWQVKAGADFNDIRVQILGSTSQSISANGALVMETTLGSITESAPETFQAGAKLKSSYTLTGNVLGFTVESYNQDLDLIIDPTREWATFHGGISGDFGSDVAVDAEGNIYTYGHTFSIDFPSTSGTFQTTKAGKIDLTISKFNSAGILIWSTFYGGTEDDISYGGITLGVDGSIYLHGFTASTNFPVTAGAFQPEYGGGDFDSFLIKLNNDGSRSWATYLGGADTDSGQGGCITDLEGNIIIQGWTASTNFPVTANAYQPVHAGIIDIYLAKISPDGSLIWSTFFGGSARDFGHGSCTVDSGNNIYIHGNTLSPDFPVSTQAFQSTSAGSHDVYLTKFTTAGSMVWSTYFGGNASDYGTGGCVVDQANNVYIQGYSRSTNLPTTSGSFQPVFGGGFRDAFLAKFDQTGILQWSTYFGGAGDDLGSGGLALDGSNNIYMQGRTLSNNLYTTPNAFQASASGGWDIYLAQFSESGQPLWSTYYGGAQNDQADGGLVYGPEDMLIAFGWTRSANFPVSAGANQSQFAGGADQYLIKFSTILSTTNNMLRMSDLTVWPNPTNGTATLSLNPRISGIVIIDVLDLKGNIVKHILTKSISSGQTYFLDADFSDLAAGIYVVQVSGSGEVVTKKLVVTR